MPPALPTPVPATCPSCGKVGALPLPIVYERGTLTGTARGPYADEAVVVHTALARQAAPPAKVTPRAIVLAAAGALVSTGVCLLPVARFSLHPGRDVQAAGAAIVACLLLAPLAGAFLGYLLGKRLGPSARERDHQARLALWHRTWICPDCQQPFLP